MTSRPTTQLTMGKTIDLSDLVYLVTNIILKLNGAPLGINASNNVTNAITCIFILSKIVPEKQLSEGTIYLALKLITPKGNGQK